MKEPTPEQGQPPNPVPWLLTIQIHLVSALVAGAVSLTLFVLLAIPLIQRQEEIRHVKPLTVTAYSPRRVETDSTPFVNAAMRRVREGQVAVSRDLFLSGWVFHREVWIQGHGIFKIMDLMAKKHKNGKVITNSIDVFLFNTHKAREFGRKELIVALLGGKG